MRTANRNLTHFSHNLWLMLGLFVIVAITFVFYVLAEKEVDHANTVRQQSFLLADELRHSSDDLTRMVRTYVATGDRIYKRHYQEILDIRDGRQPRPLDYQHVYWDLVLADDRRPRPPGPAVSLLDLMQRAGFTDAEFIKLAEAKRNSDALTQTEFAAMILIESTDPPTGTNRAVTTRMLYDAAYEQAKAGIMLPISQFQGMADRRTLLALHAAEAVATDIRIALLLLGILLVFLLWRARQDLRALLGSTVTDLHTRIVRLGSGDFSSPIPVAEGMDHSILCWLSQTQRNLARIDARRRHAEARSQRLTQLYAALSQCNEAIVRCTGEAELFAQICRVVVDFGGMRMAWIGALDEHGRGDEIVPIASFGRGAAYLKGTRIVVGADDANGRGPTGTAFRENRPIWCQRFQHDPATTPWHDRAAQFGWAACAALPLHRDDVVVKVFTLYADIEGAFDDEVRELLSTMAVDIDHALKNFEREAQRERAEAHIQYLAHFDVLTGLPNRAHLHSLAQHALSSAQRNGGEMALLFIDIDNFKDINDSLGHSIGDTLLVKLAGRLRLALRDEDTVSRLGGDEFICLLSATDAHGAAQVAQKLLTVIGAPYRIESHDLNVTGSIGIAMYPEDGAELETLFKNADAAMYRAKQEGRDAYRFFTAEMQARSARHLLLVNALRQALERAQLQLHYQPQVSLRDGKIVGAEALLRWIHPELGAISPAEFIPAAEGSGLILPIGEWVLRQAIRQARRWMQEGLAPLVMAVNLSAVQFRHADLPALVARVLDEEGLPPEYLELELTEGVAVHDPQGAIAMMNQLHERGVRMSIDDFGTGYSSLSHLKKFMVYKLKIDQTFVRDICTDPEDRAIVGAVIHMAQSLGLRTIAEGVETAGQLAFLREQGCDEMQGYFYSKPLAADQFDAFVRSET